MDYIDLIERYCEGRMDKTEMADFEDKISANSDLAEYVQLWKLGVDFTELFPDKIEEFEKAKEKQQKTMLLDEWDREDNHELVRRIHYLKVIMKGKVSPELKEWLSTEAIFYSELIDSVLKTNEISTDGQYTGLRSKEDLVLSLEEAYKVFTEINTLTDEYLYYKHRGHQGGQDDVSDTFQVNEISKEPVKELSIYRRKPGIFWSIAASFAVLVAASSIIWVQLSQSSNGKLYSEYYEKMDAPVVFRDANNVSEKAFDQAMIAYKNGQFQEAVKQFSTISLSDNQYIPASFFRGLSYMEIGDYQKASADLEVVSNASSSNLSLDAKWYLALSLIKQDKIDEAKQMLASIYVEKSYHSREALEILAKLKV